MFGKRAEEAEDAISRAEAMLVVLQLSKADLSPAKRLISQAREASNRRAYDSARVLATRAETLASSLEGRYRAAQKALSALRGIANKARELGLDASELDAEVAEARRVAQAGTVEDGVKVPNYTRARAILETAVQAGRERVKVAQGAANEIFTAELALDALKDVAGDIEPAEFERMVMKGGGSLVEAAKQAFDAGRLEEAELTARKAGTAAKEALMARDSAFATLDEAQNRIAELRSTGAVAPGPVRLLQQGWILLDTAKFTEAGQAFEAADREARRIEDDFRRATKGVKDAEEGLASLRRSGATPEQAEQALRDAKQSLTEGEYDQAIAFASDARKALGKRQEIRERLARSIEETKRSLDELRAAGMDYANDVEEMVLRAEREFENGDFVTSSEDLKIANLLIGPRPGTRSAAKPRSAPAGNP